MAQIDKSYKSTWVYVYSTLADPIKGIIPTSKNGIYIKLDMSYEELSEFNREQQKGIIQAELYGLKISENFHRFSFDINRFWWLNSSSASYLIELIDEGTMTFDKRLADFVKSLNDKSSNRDLAKGYILHALYLCDPQKNSNKEKVELFISKAKALLDGCSIEDIRIFKNELTDEFLLDNQEEKRLARILNIG